MIDEKTTLGELANSFVRMVREEAKNDAIKSAHVQDNLITATLFNTKTVDGQTEMVLKYSINGKPFVAKEYYNPTPQEQRYFVKDGIFLTEKLIDVVTKDINFTILSMLEGLI